MELTDITWVLELIVAIVGILLAKYVIPWLKRKVIEADNKDLEFWLDFVVKAAEEKYKDVASSGLLKFDFAKTKLEEQGFTFDDGTIEVLIDGKVRELFNWDDYPNGGAGGTDE